MSNSDSPSAEPRSVPEVLTVTWRTATTDPDPLVALGAVRALDPLLASWEGQLAREAQAAGATWETIGETIGVTRQAAWARFRTEIDDYRHQIEQEARDMRARHRQEVRDLRDRVRNDFGSRRRGHR